MPQIAVFGSTWADAAVTALAQGDTRTIDLGLVYGAKYKDGIRGEGAMKQARDFCRTHWWLRTVVRLKMAFFFSGLRVVGADDKTRTWLAAGRNARLKRLKKFAGDAARDWITTSSAVATWATWMKNPMLTKAESVRKYASFGGVEAMTITIGQQSGEAPASAHDGWKKKWETGGDVELDREQGDDWRVCTDERTGDGLAHPLVATALSLYAALEALNKADWTGSVLHGNIIRQLRKGFMLPGGAANNQGKVEKTYTAAELDRVVKAGSKKRGGQDWATNHDLEVLFQYLKPEFFDPKKYEGVERMLRTWAGAVAEMQDDKPSQYVITQLQGECKEAREDLGAFLSDVANDSPLLDAGQGRRPAGSDIVVDWSPTACWDSKTLLEVCRMLIGQGAMSVTTMREWFALDDKLERERLKMELAKPDEYRPGFEPKQGMSTDNTGGRPQQQASDTTTTQ